MRVAEAEVVELEEVEVEVEVQQESPSACPSCYLNSWASYPTRTT